VPALNSRLTRWQLFTSLLGLVALPSLKRYCEQLYEESSSAIFIQYQSLQDTDSGDAQTGAATFEGTMEPIDERSHTESTTAQDQKTPLQRISQRLSFLRKTAKDKFVKLYPLLHALLGGSSIAFQIAYIFNLTPHHSLWSLVTKYQIKRLTENDYAFKFNFRDCNSRET
jgi:Pex2 / Pex12 amino terminal region